MTRSGYQALGFVVWRGAKWYLRRRYGRYLSRPALIGGAVALGVGAAAAAAASRRSSG